MFFCSHPLKPQYKQTVQKKYCTVNILFILMVSMENSVEYSIFYCNCNAKSHCKIHTFLYKISCCITYMGILCENNEIPNFIKHFLSKIF